MGEGGSTKGGTAKNRLRGPATVGTCGVRSGGVPMIHAPFLLAVVLLPANVDDSIVVGAFLGVATGLLLLVARALRRQ